MLCNSWDGAFRHASARCMAKVVGCNLLLVKGLLTVPPVPPVPPLPCWLLQFFIVAAFGFVEECCFFYPSLECSYGHTALAGCEYALCCGEGFFGEGVVDGVFEG